MNRICLYLFLWLPWLFASAQQSRMLTSDRELSGSVVTDIIQDDDGFVWMATYNGLNRFDGFHVRHFRRSNAEGALGSDCINGLCIDSDGRLLVGTAHGLYVWQKQTETFQQLSMLHVDGRPLTDCNVVCFALTKEGDVLCGSSGFGVFLLKRGGLQAEVDNRWPTDCDVRHIDVGKKGEISLDTLGVWRPLAMTDRDGNVWRAIFQKGVEVTTHRRLPFQAIGRIQGEDNPIGEHCVMSCYTDRSGFRWVGTEGDGVYVLNTDGTLFMHLSPGLVPPNVLAITEDNEGRMWMGTYGEGAGFFDKKSKKFTSLPFTKEGDASRVFDLCIDVENRLWIATLGDGLKCYDLHTGDLEEYRQQSHRSSADENCLPNSWVTALCLSRDGKRLYIGMANGLTCLELKNRSFTSVFGCNQLLTYMNVRDIHEDAEGVLWVATEFGLYRIASNGKEIQCMTTGDGLPDNSVMSVQTDADGRVWVGTSHGLAMFDASRHRFINYFAQAGLHGNDFSDRTVCREGDSVLVFGGLGGITLFHPRQTLQEETPPHILLTGLSVNGLPRAVGDSKFDFSHNDNTLTLQLSSMDFVTPELVEFLYTINDETWVMLPAGTTELTLARLSPGRYDLKVKSRRAGVESAPLYISINIRPPWYATWWAYTFYAACALLLLILYVRKRRQRIQLQRRVQEHVHATELREIQKHHRGMAEAQLPPTQAPTADERLLERVMKTVNAHFDESELSVEQIAQEVGLSRSHLHRKMKELTGQSVSGFVRTLRLHRAAQLLEQGGRSVGEVMTLCGFDSPSTFSTSFKTFFGLSPTDYVKEHR